MDQSIFMEQESRPNDRDLQQALGSSYVCWKDISNYVQEQCPNAGLSWHYSKAGWNCRISDAKRVVIYLMPCKGYFNASFVLGNKALETALSAGIQNAYKQIISSAKAYAEGTGFRLPIKSRKAVVDLKILIDLKCNNQPIAVRGRDDKILPHPWLFQTVHRGIGYQYLLFGSLPETGYAGRASVEMVLPFDAAVRRTPVSTWEPAGEFFLDLADGPVIINLDDHNLEFYLNSLQAKNLIVQHP